jgi:CHAT domain-containing protein/tetratricopeptide (TPR) repeat protein
VSLVLLLAALPAAAGQKEKYPADRASAEETLRDAEKKREAGELGRALELFRELTGERSNRVRRRAFDRLIELTQRLGLFDETVRAGNLYRKELEGSADRKRRAEVTVEIGLACEALAQHALAEKELLAAQRVVEEASAPMLRLVLLAGLARVAGVLHGPARAKERWKAAETAAVALIDRRRVPLSLAQRSEAVWRLAECYASQKRHAEALGRLAALLKELEGEKDQEAQRVATLRHRAEHQEALGRFQEAASSLCQAIRLYKDLPGRDHLVEGELHDELGDVFGKARLPAEAARARAVAARAYLDVLHGRHARRAGPFAASQAFWRMQRLYEKTRQYRQALQLMDDIHKDAPVPVTDPRFKSENAALFVFLGSYGAAHGLLRDAVDRFEAGKPLNLIQLPRALNNLAVVEQATGHLRRAEELGQRCVKLYRDHHLPDDETLGEAWNLLGTNANLLGHFERGVQHFRAGAALCERLGPKADRLLSSLLLNHALLYLSQGDLALAREQLRKALAVYQRSEEPDSLGVALFECALASLYVKDGQYAEALPLAGRVLERCRQHNITGGLVVHTAQHCQALGHLQRGVTALRQGRRDQAQSELAQAEKLWSDVRAAQEKAREHRLLPQTLNHLGQLAEINGKHDEAMKQYEKARTIQEEVEAGTDGALIPTTRFVTLWRLAELRYRQGKRAEAQKTLVGAIEMVEAVRQRTYGDAQQRTTFLAQFVPGFEQAVEWARRDGKHEEAFNLAARVRSRAFLDQLLLAGADPRATLKGPQGTALRKKEVQLRERLAGLRAELTLVPAEAHGHDRARSLVADFKQARQEFAEVWREVLNASDLYRVLADEAVVTRPLANVRNKVLPPRTALVAYHLQRHRSFALLVTPDQQAPRMFELRVPAELLAELKRDLPSASAWGDDAQRRGLAVRRRRVAGLIPADAPSTADVPLSQPLAALLVEHYRCLLEGPGFATVRGLKVVARSGAGKKAVRGLPGWAEVLLPAELRQHLRGLDQVLVVPDGPLHKLPLEALLLESEPRPRFVLDDLPPLLYAPSVSALAYLARRPPGANAPGSPRARSLLTVCDPAYAAPATKHPDSGPRLPAVLTGRMPRLPFTALESERIRSHFPDNPVTVLAREDATEERVRREMARHSMLHVAAHGFADERLGNLFGALALTPPPAGQARPDNDGFLALYEIYQLPLSGCELAVLSACETNVGPQQPLEAGVTLASGFLAAGARRVVASHWSVDDRSTAELMGAFFKEITAKGSTPASWPRALYRARLRLRNRPATAGPFHWAPFVLIGVPGD